MKNIIRIKKETNYVVLDKYFINDIKLSWKAKGIMAYMLSKPDNWTFYIDELVKHSADGKSSFRSGFKELQDYGYVKRMRTRNKKGTFDWETIVQERPHTDFPQVDKPVVDKPQMDKPQVDNRKLLSNDELSNKELSNEEVSNDKKTVVEKLDIDFSEIVEYLNLKAGKQYRATTKKTQSLIKARVNEGFTTDDFKKVIDNKAAEWKNDNDMNKFLRPETLFGNKFEGYLNQEVKKNLVDIGYNPDVDSF